MSKKSRRRNRRLALLGALGAGLMLAGRGRGTAAANVDSGRGSGLRPTVDKMPKGIDKGVKIFCKHPIIIVYRKCVYAVNKNEIPLRLIRLQNV